MFLNLVKYVILKRNYKCTLNLKKIIKMKKLALIMFAMLTISISMAQDDDFQTIFGDDELSISGFGGPFMSFTTVAGDFAHMMGGGGGIILNKKILFGGYGIGKTTRVPLNLAMVNDPSFVQNYANELYNMELDFGHGGLFAGYVFNGNAALHPIFLVQFGWGSASVGNNEFIPYRSDNVFVLNPVLELEMNVTRFFRLGFGANYTLVTGVNNLFDYKNADFSSHFSYFFQVVTKLHSCLHHKLPTANIQKKNQQFV